MSESSELQRAVENLTRAVEKLEENLVRKDVYQSDQKGVQAEITGLKAGLITNSNAVEKIEERRAADRRLLLTSFGLPLILIIIQLYLAARVGGS